jgi:hypothetical protein
MSAALAIAFLALAPAAGASLTIDAKPNPTTFGDTTTISGNLSDSIYSRTITLEANPAPFTAGFQAAASTDADANGNYSFTKVAPTLNTRYRTTSDGCVTICPLESTVIVCPVLLQYSPQPCGGGEMSPELLVEVKIDVSLRVKATGRDRVRFYGTVAPAHDALTVHIQRRRSSGKWVDVAHTTLKNSRFSRSFVPRPGRYRARVDHDADHADGTSHSRRVS